MAQVKLGGNCICIVAYNFSHFAIILPKFIKIGENVSKF